MLFFHKPVTTKQQAIVKAFTESFILDINHICISEPIAEYYYIADKQGSVFLKLKNETCVDKLKIYLSIEGYSSAISVSTLARTVNGTQWSPVVFQDEAEFILNYTFKITAKNEDAAVSKLNELLSNNIVQELAVDSDVTAC